MAIKLKLDHARSFLIQQYRRTPAEVWLAIGLALVGVFLRLKVIPFVTNNYDEGVYTAALRSFTAGNALYRQVYMAQPPYFILLLAPWFILGGKTIVAARYGVLFYSLFGVIGVWALARSLSGPLAGLLAVAALTFDPLYFTQSVSAQAEAPAVAMMIVAVAFAASAKNKPDMRKTFFAGFFFTVGILIKLFIVPAIIPILYFLLFPYGLPRAPKSWSAMWIIFQERRRLFAFLGLGIWVAALPAMVLFLQDPSAMWNQVIGLHVAATGAYAQNRLNNISLFFSIWWEAPLVVGATAISIWLYKKQQCADGLILLLWGYSSIVVLLIQTPLFDHHLVLIVPGFIASLSLIAQDTLLASVRFQIRGAAQTAIAGFLVVVFLSAGAVTLHRVSSDAQTTASDLSITAVAFELDALTSPQEYVVTDDQVIADLANRNIPPELVDTSSVRIASGSLTSADVIQQLQNPQVVAVLWYSGRFNALPGLLAYVKAHFTAVIHYGGGRVLYIRTPPALPVAAVKNSGSMISGYKCRDSQGAAPAPCAGIGVSPNTFLYK